MSNDREAGDDMSDLKIACVYCRKTSDALFAEAMMQALGARLSWNPAKCPKAPITMKRGPRGGTKYVREHVLREVT